METNKKAKRYIVLDFKKYSPSNSLYINKFVVE